MRAWVLVGSLPPPATGQSIAFQMLVDACRARGVPHKVVDLGARTPATQPGTLTLTRLLQLIRPVFRYLGCILPGRTVVYLTMAQSWSGFLRDAAIILPAWLGRHRIVLHLHGSNYGVFYAQQSRLRQWAIRSVLSKVHRFVVLGEALKPMFAFLPALEHKLSVIMNGLPLDPKLLPAEPKTLPTEPQDQVRMLYLSNLSEPKGYLDVLETVRILVREQGLNIHCSFCGEFKLAIGGEQYSAPDEAQEDFHKRITRAGLEDHVVWPGVVSGSRKVDQLRRAHFFLLPSTNEGQPLSIIEALAFGCVVLSTRCGTIPQMLDDGRVGVLIEARNPRSIVAAVTKLMDNPPAFKTLSVNARRQYERYFTAERYLDSLLGELDAQARHT